MCDENSLIIDVAGGILFRMQTEGANSNNDGCVSHGVVDVVNDETERVYFKRLPTSFKLKPEHVDQLRDVAHRLFVQSEEFQRLLRDLK
jgi:hypothetical protein